MAIADFRVITNYKVAGTRSFRLGSSKVLDRWGMNLQNPDKHTQDICVAPPGHKIVQADQSGAEALVVAYLARPGRYRALFENGVKPHTYLAMHLFASLFKLNPDSPFLHEEVAEFIKRPEWEALHKLIKKSGKPYDIGKRTAHGSSYRMGARTFRDANIKQSKGTLRLSFAECVKFLAKFRELFPEVVEWQEEIEIRVRSARILANLFGYERRFERELNDSYIREAISWIPQSTVGCITHLGIRAARRERLSVCSNKHDSYAVICRDDEVDQVAAFMRKSMSVTLPGRDCSFTMKSEVQVGQNWQPRDIDNPEGMYAPNELN